MALILKDRVKETTTVTGTGTASLLGAVTGFQSFSAIGNANTTYYCIANGSSEWEVGIGTYTASGTTLARTTVLSSSNAGSLVNFSAGTKDVFVTFPASVVNSMTLLGTLNTTSGSTQTLSSLSLANYSMLVVEIFEVSNSGTSGNFTMAGQALCGVSGTASNAIFGIVQVMLQSGATVSNVANNKAIGSVSLTSGGTTTSSGNLAVTNSTTSIAFAMSAGAFDNGVIRVYGVK